MALRSIFLALVAVCRFVIGLGAYAIALAYLAMLGFEFVAAPKLAQSAVMLRADHLLAPSVRAVSSWAGWHWPPGESKNFAPLILAIAVVFARTVLDGLLLRLDFAIRRIFKKPVRVRYRADEAHAPERNHYKLSAETEQQRAVLLKRYREIEDALKSASKKSCTFLSIDVVGSTKMKVGERKTAIDATFQAYEELVRRTFDSYGVWKETWTPDGVMACFLDCELAVNAAQQILSALPAFNHQENQLRTPIRIRCGLNEGEVAIFEDSQLEKVADHSIDIAGHMQKYAAEDALQISDLIYDKLQRRDGFVATGRQVDGFNTYEWTVPAEEGASEPAVPVV